MNTFQLVRKAKLKTMFVHFTFQVEAKQHIIGEVCCFTQELQGWSFLPLGMSGESFWLIKLASCNKEDTSFFITCSSEWYTVLSGHAQARWSINQPLYHLPIPEPKYLKILTHTHTHKREVLKSSQQNPLWKIWSNNEI